MHTPVTPPECSGLVPPTHSEARTLCARLCLELRPSSTTDPDAACGALHTFRFSPLTKQSSQSSAQPQACGKGAPMEPASDPYLDVALIYIRLVRNDSLEAASLIEKIHSGFGSRAGLRAALVMKIFKMEVKLFLAIILQMVIVLAVWILMTKINTMRLKIYSLELIHWVKFWPIRKLEFQISRIRTLFVFLLKNIPNWGICSTSIAGHLHTLMLIVMRYTGESPYSRKIYSALLKHGWAMIIMFQIKLENTDWDLIIQDFSLN